MILYRYVMKEILLTFLFVSFAFYFLYILIDYSAHLKLFGQENISFFTLVKYYFLEWTNKSELLLPLALMISTLKVLTGMNRRFEITAILSSGYSFHAFFRPFMTLGIALTLFQLLNFQYIQPKAFSFLNRFETAYLKKKSQNPQVHVLTLSNQAELIYQDYDFEKRCFSNVFLMTSLDKIYRIETLLIEDKCAIAKNVDLLLRTHGMEMGKKENYPSMIFPKIVIDEKKLKEETIGLKAQSIQELLLKIPYKAKFFAKLSDKDAKILTTAFYKLLIPFLSLLAVFAPASFSVQRVRHLNVFLLYALFLLGMFSFFAVIQSLTILSEHQILSPWFALLLPFSCVMTYFGIRHARL